MAYLFLTYLIFSLAFACNSDYSLFINQEPQQCTGTFAPKQVPQERWEEVVEWVKNRAPSAFVDERIAMIHGNFGEAVTGSVETIKAGEVLLRLPLKALFLEEDCFPTEVFEKLGTGYVSSLRPNFPRNTWNTSSVGDNTQAGLCLLIHRWLGKASAFEGYIKHLPRQASSDTYMFRSLSDMEVLRGTHPFLMASVAKRRHSQAVETTVGVAFDALREYFPHLNFTREQMKLELAQTLSLCSSRIFSLDSSMLAPSSSLSPKLSRPALVPLLDMLNHADERTRNCQYFYNITGQYFVLQTIRNILPGEELIHSYGKRSNAELLLSYGFLIANNTEDYIIVNEFTQSILDYNYHFFRLSSSSSSSASPFPYYSSFPVLSLHCFGPFFLPVQYSSWPPSFQLPIKFASPFSFSTLLNLGPCSPSQYYDFLGKLQHYSRLRLSISKIQNKTQVPAEVLSELHAITTMFADLAHNAHGGALVRVGGNENSSGSGAVEDKEDSDVRGDLTVKLVWGTATPGDCTKPRCEQYVEENAKSSVSVVLEQLNKNELPSVVRAGGCRMWSQRKQQMFELTLNEGREVKWNAVAVGAVAADAHTDERRQDLNAEEEERLVEEFQFKRYLLHVANLAEPSVKISRSGLSFKTLAAIRIAVLPFLSSFAVHSILSGQRLSLLLEQQVAKTISMFCLEETARRLQVFGINIETNSLSDVLNKARLLAVDQTGNTYDHLAKSELQILFQFCVGVHG